MAGRPPAGKVQLKENMIRDIEGVYDALNKARAKITGQDLKIIDLEKQILDLQNKLVSEKSEELSDLLTENMAMGHLVKRMRKAHSLSLDKLSRLLFMNKTSLNNVESGKAKYETTREVYERVRIMKQRGELNETKTKN